ncbi:MAG: 1,4-dihydroxy-6-naphthoate synthase [Desulfovibrionaceae bacterium]
MHTLTLGYSPCPNDTYIFHALAAGLTPVAGYATDIFLADVEELNALAAKGIPDVVKVSTAAAAGLLDTYVLLRAGGAMGFGCGPVLVGRDDRPLEAYRNATVAIPGRRTTANLLLECHGGFAGPRLELVFDQVMPAVAEGRADLGVVIHEGRFTYAAHGLRKRLDLGQWWEEAFALPLPLGCIAIRRSLGPDAAKAVQRAIRASLAHANADPVAPWDYITAHAQEMDPEVIRNHIATFVTPFSHDIGDAGEHAMRTLLAKACALSGRALPDLPLFVA